MPKKASNQPQFVESEATSAKAKFFYVGAFQISRRK